MADLSRLLRPTSIAIVGGGAWGRNIIRNLKKGGFAGQIWPVHPKQDTVEGVAAFTSVSDLPTAPDIAYVAVNRHLTIEIVGALSAMGAGGAICFASGFSEAVAEDASGVDLQAKLLSAAGDMTIIGPNCYGYLNYLDGAVLWPDQHGGTRIDRGVAIIAQSSNMAINISMQRRGVPLGYLMTAGNQAQTGFSTLGKGLLEDERVSVLGLHIEGVDDLEALQSLAKRARELGKSIVVLKVGKSDQAQAATVSHTASLAGSDAGSTALFRRLGIAQVSNLPALLETLKLLHVVGPITSNRVASMSCSGGEASLMADMALSHDLDFAPLDEGQETALRGALGPMVALANPLDYHTYIWRDREKIAETFAAMMLGELGLGMVVLDFPRQDRCDPVEWYDVTHGAAIASAQSGKPMAIVASLPECMPENEAVKLVDAGVAPLCGMDEALQAVSAAAWLGRVHVVPEPLVLPGADRAVVLIGEAEAKAELSAFGMRTPKNARAETGVGAGEIATKIGFPVVLKGEGFAHKTEMGAVKVGLSNQNEVTQAAADMGASGYLVEEMITDTIAELLVGVIRDPAHGFVLTLGAGGQLAELLQDTVSLLVPASRGAVSHALNGLRCAKLLAGYRGGRSANLDAVLDSVMAVQDYVVANADRLEEVEINPLLATPTGAVAVDALLRRT